MLFGQSIPSLTRKMDTPTRFGLQSYELSTEPPKQSSSKKNGWKEISIN